MPEPAAPARPTLLYLDGVTVDFDGFHALDDLSLVIEEGELRTIIGPNGAGKTTLMDVVTGKTRPTNGRVLFREHVDLTRLDETAIANLGIGRKFQKPTVFQNLTVVVNLALALKADRAIGKALFARLPDEHAERIDRVLATVGLVEQRDLLAGSLSHGQKQWLEIGMLLIQDGELLLLDEPVAGMTDHETERTAALIRDIAGRHTVVVVEHDMQFVRDLASKTTVLHEGRVLAEGSIEAVQANQAVIEVYLGR